jgi:hypothetical protein
MHCKFMMSIAALVLGTACAAAPALAAKKVKPIVIHPAIYNYSNTGPAGSAPLSPNGISAAASAYGGPGFNGPYGDQTQTHVTPMNFSTSGPKGTPLSPGGIGAAASAFGGPGYNGPYETTPHASTTKYSTMGPSGAPLSPNGIGAAANAFGGPGYLQ